MKKIIAAFFVYFVLLSSAFASDFTQGIKCINSNNYKKASEIFQTYVNNNPNDPDGHYWLGLCYKHLGETDLSRLHLERSYELSQSVDDVDVSDIAPVENLEDYIDIGVMYLETKSYDKAHIYADMILKMNPNNPEGYYLRARIYDAQEEPDSAKAALIRAIQADNDIVKSELAKKYEIMEVPPYDFQYYNARGIELYYRGEIDKAIQCFKKSLNMNFKNTQALNNLANAYLKQGNFSEAKSALNKAKLINPKNFQTYLNLAKTSKLQSQEDNISNILKKKYQNEEKNYLKRALSVNPNDKRAYLMLGNYYLEQKNYDEAIANFTTALVLDEDYYEAYFGLAASYIENNQFQNALIALRNAGSLNENADEISFYLAKMCILDNKFDEAKNYLNDALDKARKSEYLLELGKIYYYQNDFQSAKNAFDEALTLDIRFKNSAEIYNYLGLCAYRTYDLKNALTYLQKAHQMNEDKVIYTYNLALAYKSANQNDMYQKLYQKVMSFRPNCAGDYVDLSGILADQQKYQAAMIVIDEGIAKFPKEKILYNAKLKLAKTTKSDTTAQEVIKTMNTLFN